MTSDQPASATTPNGTATPTGIRTPTGIAIPRRIDLSLDELWAWITDPDRTALWFGRWSGDPASGAVQVQLAAEDGTPTTTTEILECRRPSAAAPGRLVTRNGLGWVVTLEISAGADESIVTLRQDLDDADAATMIGPGWEFYLDRLETVIAGGDAQAITFEPDYVPGQCDHYRRLFTTT